MSSNGWNVIDADGAVLWREYSFSKGASATTFVMRGDDGLIVISPGSGLSAADFDALASYGEVRALIANNTFHHLGQAAWRERFPKAESYAAPGALAKLRKKQPKIPFRSTDELKLPPDVHVEALPGFKNGELVARAKTKQGSVWYTGDLLTNIQKVPGPPIRWLFSMTDSAPGFRLFRLSIMLFANDKRALKERATALASDDPPSIVVPGHGPAVTAGDVASEVRTQLGRL
jgi:glyoxylase-like metal-dependent hydrolase (beta-lactamase superfamily II)